jgi:HEAT repeat protein
MERLKNDTFRNDAMEALGQIGPRAEAAAPLLVQMAKDGNEESRLNIYPALAGIGPACREALPVLYAGARGDSLQLQAVALHALARVEPDETKVMAELVQGLKSESHRTRRVAYIELKRIGEKAQEAVPSLVPLLDRETDRVEALDCLRGVHPNSVPVLVQLLQNKDVSVRRYACEALGGLGPSAREAAGVLHDKADHDEDRVKEAARAALVKIEGA